MGTYMWARDPDLLLKLSLEAAIALNWCATSATVRDYNKQGVNILCLDYRDLVSKPTVSWKALADFCSLSVVDEAALLATRNKDSQKSSFLSRGVLASSSYKPDDSWLPHLETFLQAFNIDQHLQCLPNMVDTQKEESTVLDLEND